MTDAERSLRPPNPLPRRSLTANTIYAVVGNGFFYACQLAVVALLAKFATPAIQGEYFLGLAIAGPVVLFCGLELRGAFVADAGNQFTFGTYYALRWLMLIPAGVALGGFLLREAVVAPAPAHLLILGGVFAVRMIWSLAEVGWGTFQRRERMDLVAISAALRGVALLLPFAVLLPVCSVWAQRGQLSGTQLAIWAGVATLIAAVGTGLSFRLFDRPRVRAPGQWDLSWTWSQARALAWQTLPLGAVVLIVNLCDSFPRIFIEHLPDGAAQLGYFGALAYITLAPNLVVLQAATAAANRLSLYYQQNLPALLWLGGRLVLLALGVGGAMLAVALLLGHWILSVLYTPEYAQYEGAFRIVVVAQCLALLTNVFGTATTQMRLFWLQVPAQVITLIATVVAAVILIPPDPVRGAALTALVRAIVQLVLYTVCVGVGLGFRGRILRRNSTAAASLPRE